VRTIRELFDMMNGAHEQAFRRVSEPRPAPGWNQPGQGWNQPQSWPGGPGGSADDGDYDHYNVEGSDPALRQDRRGRGGSSDGAAAALSGDPAAAAISIAMGFAARAVGRRMKKTFDERVVPAMQERAANFHQAWEQSKAEQDAIVARYPELRSCVKDGLVFLDGGRRTVPVAELKMPVTLAQADSVVAQLR
jgi:hypothetical protein